MRNWGFVKFRNHVECTGVRSISQSWKAGVEGKRRWMKMLYVCYNAHQYVCWNYWVSDCIGCQWCWQEAFSLTVEHRISERRWREVNDDVLCSCHNQVKNLGPIKFRETCRWSVLGFGQSANIERQRWKEKEEGSWMIMLYGHYMLFNMFDGITE